MSNESMTTECKIAAVQAILGVDVDGIWKEKTEAALEKLLSRKPPVNLDRGNLLGTLEDCNVYVVEDYGRMRVQWRAKMAVCNDGSGGNPDNDPCHQAQTAYYNNGKFLNPYKVPYIVVPPLIRYGVPPVVMGCQGVILNLENGLCTPAIVGDEGPDDKIGEASVEGAERVGLSGSPNSGGTSEHIIAYVIWPGIAARVDGVTYKLQPS